jgi:hypothetical protein
LWPESVEALFEEEPALQALAHYTEKKRLLFDQGQIDGWHSLNAIYVLTHPDRLEETTTVCIAPLTTSEAFIEIVKHTFQLDITDRNKLGQAFKRYEWLAKSVPFFSLAFPRDHSLLPDVNQAILNHFELYQPDRS